MKVKFELSKETKTNMEPDGKHYLVYNGTGSILLTLDELGELNKVMGKAEKSKRDFRGVTDDYRDFKAECCWG